MLADKRHSMILGIVNDEGSATVGDLAERIGISESTIRRDLAQLADAGKLNKVHITPETVYMEFSTCENQDCVGQGEVHVDTYKDRILGTYIICLPNNVSIEMVPADN